MPDCLQKAFQTGTNTRLDERIFTMCQVKNQPLVYLMLMTHPSLYRVDTLTDEVSLGLATYLFDPKDLCDVKVNVLEISQVFHIKAAQLKCNVSYSPTCCIYAFVIWNWID